MSKAAPLHFNQRTEITVTYPRVTRLAAAFEAALDEIYVNYALRAAMLPTGVFYHEDYWKRVGKNLARLRACAEGETI